MFGKDLSACNTFGYSGYNVFKKKKKKTRTFTFCLLAYKMYRFEEDIFFFLKMAKIHKNGDKKGSTVDWQQENDQSLIISLRELIRIKIYPGFGFIEIYIEILHIFYIYFFLSRC